MSEFAVRLEESLSRFLLHDNNKATRSRHTEGRQSQHCRCTHTSLQAQNLGRCSEEHQNTIPVNAGDFSSAEEDALDGSSSTIAQQDELFDTPPSSLIVDGSGFSPEPDSLPSTIDPSTDSCSTILSSDFSDDEEFPEEERRVPPLVRRFSSSLKMSSQFNEHESAAKQCSSATSLPHCEEIDEFSE